MLTFHDIFFLVISAFLALCATICSVLFFVFAAKLQKEDGA